jgi:hypothetical protein
MYNDIIALRSQIHTHINAFCGQNVEYLLVVSKGTVGLYSVNITEL